MTIADITNGESGSGVRGKLNSVIAAVNGGREVLTADRTYYVRADGDDGNDGLTDSSGGAFLTPQKLADTIKTIDPGIYELKGKFGSGTYAGFSYSGGSPGNIVFEGDVTTPANVTLNTLTTLENAVATITLNGLNFAAATGESLFITTTNRAKIADCRIVGASSATALLITGQSVLSILGPITFAGSTGRAILVKGAELNRDHLSAPSSVTLTVSGNPTYSQAFIRCDAGFVELPSANISFSGSATGPRFLVQLNGVINTFGGGTSFFPGSTIPSTPYPSGGQYA